MKKIGVILSLLCSLSMLGSQSGAPEPRTLESVLKEHQVALGQLKGNQDELQRSLAFVIDAHNRGVTNVERLYAGQKNLADGLSAVAQTVAQHGQQIGSTMGNEPKSSRWVSPRLVMDAATWCVIGYLWFNQQASSC